MELLSNSSRYANHKKFIGAISNAYSCTAGTYVIIIVITVFAGVGVAMVTVSLIVCIYYNVIMSYTIYYMFASISEVVPWSICDPEWANMSTCYVRSMTANKTVRNGRMGNYP